MISIDHSMEFFIYLSPDEIKERISRLEHLVENPKHHHFHFSELNSKLDIEREITISIYTNNNINEFDERSKKYC